MARFSQSLKVMALFVFSMKNNSNNCTVMLWNSKRTKLRLPVTTKSSCQKHSMQVMVISWQFINCIFIKIGKTAGASALIAKQGTGKNSTTEPQCTPLNKGVLSGVVWTLTWASLNGLYAGAILSRWKGEEGERETEGKWLKWKGKTTSWMQEWALQL